MVRDVPEIHGHRGARALSPENTLPGFARALALGVDAIEFDVTLTADGGLILAHDLVVEATTILDTGPAADGDPLFPYVGKRWSELTLAQVATLDAGDRRPHAPYQDTFVPVPGTRVPTLRQACELIERPVVLAVEVKTHPSWPDDDVSRLTEGVLATLAATGRAARARVLAFDWRVLRVAAALDPAVPRVALAEARTWAPGSQWLAGLEPAGYEAADLVAAARDVGAAWLSPFDSLATAELIAAAHGGGLGVVVWTVNDPARMSELADLDVDGIVTDRPDLLREVLAGRCAGGYRRVTSS